MSLLPVYVQNATQWNLGRLWSSGVTIQIDAGSGTANCASAGVDVKAGFTKSQLRRSVLLAELAAELKDVAGKNFCKRRTRLVSAS